MTNPTFEQELYDVVRKWNPLPDFGAFTVIIETERLGRVFVRNVPEDEQAAKSTEPQGVFQPTMRLRWKQAERSFDKATGNYHQSLPSQFLLQQLWRSADGQEEWRAVPIES